MPVTGNPTSGWQLKGFADPASNHFVAASITVPPGVLLHGSNTAAAAAQLVVTITPTTGWTPWLLGFTVTSGAPAATVSGIITVTGLAGFAPGTGLQYQFTESSTVGGSRDIFLPAALPGLPNTNIVVTLAAVAGGAPTAGNIQGFQVVT